MIPRLLLTLALLALPARALAQAAPPEADLGRIRSAFEYGRYAEVLQQAEARLDRGGLSDEDRVELERLAALAAFNLGKPHRDDAERHFRALLRLDPDHALDPFVVPPLAIRLFESLRQQMAPELDQVRQERKERAERERQAAERLEQERAEAERARRRLEELSRQVTVRRVEKRNFLVNFVPFGAGQFQQGRPGLGATFAATEGVLAATSVLAYFLYEGQFLEGRFTLGSTRDGVTPVEIPVRYLPTERAGQANFFRYLKIGTGAGFYAVYALGVVDALVHHRDEVVTTSIEEVPVPAPAPAAQLRLSPLPGGAHAGLTVTF